MELRFDPAELKSIVAEVIAEMADRFGDDDRLAYTEVEAAQRIGVAKHVLRDERLKGRIQPGRSGRNWLYSRRILLAYVERNQEAGE